MRERKSDGSRLEKGAEGGVDFDGGEAPTVVDSRFTVTVN